MSNTQTNDGKEMSQNTSDTHNRRGRTVKVQIKRQMNTRFNVSYTKYFATKNGPDL